MKKKSSLSTVRIPLYRGKDVEVNFCASHGTFSLEIANSSTMPRMISLSNDPSNLIQVGSNCLCKLPWSSSDPRKLRQLEVEVSDSVESTLELTKEQLP